MSKNCVIMQRMKKNYESRSRTFLTRRVPVIMRLDGKAFHTYTKNLTKPFDEGLIEDMQQTAIYLCQNIQGAKCAHVQSDEISILITDYGTLQTDAWFDYNVQKMCSVSAGFAAGKFNQLRLKRDWDSIKWVDDNDLESLVLANFDSQVFSIPKEEVSNYFLARQKDAVKNSISMLAQSLYSHGKPNSDLDRKNQSELQEMRFRKGHNWNDLHFSKKRGSFIIKNIYVDDHLVNCFGENTNEASPTPTNSDDIWFDGEGYWKANISGDIYGGRPYLDWCEYKPTKIRTKWEVTETPFNFSNENFKTWL